MKNDSSRQIKVSALLSYLQMGLNIVISLIYTPIMLRLLGQSEYGLYNTVASVVSMLSILNLGFNSSYIKFFSKYKKNNDINGISKLNGAFLLIFCIIGAIAFSCGIFLTNNLRIVFRDGLRDYEYDIAKTLMVFFTINLSVSFPMSVFGNIISSHERFIFLKLLNIIRTVGTPLLTIPLLFLGYGSIAVVVVSLVIHIIVDIIYLLYVLFVLRQKFIFFGFEEGLFKDLFIFTSFIAINMIVDQINLNVDKVLLGRFKGTNAVAIYTIGYTLFTYFQMFSTCISSLFTPRVHNIVNNYEGIEEKNKLTDLFVKVGRIQFLILGLVCSGLCFFGKAFIVQFWAGAGYDDSYYVLLLLSIPSIIPLTQNIGIEIQRAKNLHKFRSIAYLIMAFINIGISVFLCQSFGAVGCAIGTCLSFVIANGLIMNFYYHKKCNIDIKSYWKNVFKIMLGMAPAICFGFIICNFISYNNILTFILWVFIYTLVYSLLQWFFVMNNKEKNIIFYYFGRVFKRKKNNVS